LRKLALTNMPCLHLKLRTSRSGLVQHALRLCCVFCSRTTETDEQTATDRRTKCQYMYHLSCNASCGASKHAHANSQDVTSRGAWTRSTYRARPYVQPCRGVRWVFHPAVAPLSVSCCRRTAIRYSRGVHTLTADGPTSCPSVHRSCPPGNQPSVAMVTVFIARSAAAATCHQPIIALHSRQSCAPPRLWTLSSPRLSLSQPSAQPLCCEIH